MTAEPTQISFQATKMALAAPPTTRALRRVVVTGIGCVSPVGATAPETWAGVLAGASNARRLTFGGKEYLAAPVHEAAAIPRARDRSRFINLAVAAAAEAVADAGPAALAVAPERRGVCVASGIGSLGDAVGAAASLAAGRKLSPYFVPRLLANMAAGAVAVDHGCRGPLTTSAAACAAGAMSIGEAYRLIEAGRADVVLCGGAESTVDEAAVAGFARLRALSSYAGDAARASRPFDEARAGFVLAEGAAVLVLEDLETAAARGARAYAEVRGFGLSADAHHATAPRPDGSGALNAMVEALRGSNLSFDDVGYVNAHAASTPLGDAAEAAAIAAAFAGRENDPVLVSSTKGATGHLLGAAGALEAAITALALRDGVAPRTANLDDPLPVGGALRLLRDNEPAALACALSNSFGFGGTNASLLLARPPADLVDARGAEAVG